MTRASRWYPVVLAALLLTCGGSTARPAPGAAVTPERTPPAVLTACPTGDGTPIAGVRRATLPCMAAGAAVRVSAVHGRPEVINFWASWCAPCRAEARVLESAHRRAGDRVLFLGVDTRDERGAALRFLGATGATYPQVFDPAATFAVGLGLPGLPYTLVVDADGSVVWRHIGVLTEQSLRDGLARAGVTLPR